MNKEQIITLIKNELKEAKKYYIEDIEEKDLIGEGICDAYYNNGYYEAISAILMMIQ